MDSLILELTTGFVGLKTNEIDEGIDRALARLGLYCEVDRVYLFLYRDQFSRVDNTHEWCAEGVSREIDNLQDICVAEELPWVNKTILASEILNIPDVSKLPEKASLEQHHFEEQNIKSLLVVPVSDNEKTLGFIGFDSVKNHREWDQHETNLLKILANNIGLLLSRKKAEETLAKSESDFRLLAEAMPQIVWITRPDGWNIYFNQQWMDYTGMTLEESLGHGWNKPFHPDDQQRAWDAWQNATKNIGVYSLECRLRRADGKYRWWLIRGVPARNTDGEIIKWFGTCTDIDDIKKTEEALKRSQQLLTETSKIGKVGGWEFDLDTETLQWTEEVYHIHEVDLDYVPTVDNALDFYTDTSKPVITEAVQRAIKQGESFDLELEIITAKDNFRNVHAIGRVDLNSRRVHGIFQDITQDKEAEKLREDLITQLRDKNAELERFVYTVSHDLKAPLVTINGFCGAIDEDLASGKLEDCKKSLGFVSHAAKRMGQLLNELLNISRVGVKINPTETVDLEVLINDAIGNVKGVVSEYNTTIEVEKGLPDVVVDRQYALQVFENLITNASRYSHSAEGGSQVKIGVIKDAEELTCYVKDNGIGIEAPYLEKVFGLFETFDKSFGGTGIGLAIVKRIVEAHGCRIWAESKGLGKGTTFYFTLPEA